MEKMMDVEDYAYSNAGQFRAIAKSLGYSESFDNGQILFSRNGEEFRYSMDELKTGNRSEGTKEGAVKESLEAVSKFFDKEKATNLDEYNKELADKGISVIKWENIKEGESDGFTIVDSQRKVAFTGKELYGYAHDANILLDGKGSEIPIPWNEMKAAGINPEMLSEADKEAIRNGMRTGMLHFSIEDNLQNRKALENENIDYTIKDGKLNFEGKATAVKYIVSENNNENRKKLSQNNIDYIENGNKLKVEGLNARKLAIAGITLVYPVAGIALMLVPKRKEMKNEFKKEDFSLTKSELKSLKKGEIVVKTQNGEKMLFQRDKDTNEIMSVKMKDLKIPHKIAGVELTPLQYEAFRQGKEITIENELLNKSIKVRLDLNEKNGIAYRDERVLKEETTEKKEETTEKKEIPITERDRLEYISKNGAKGIDDIFKENPSEMTAFLEKHNLSKDYTSYKEVEKNFSTTNEEKGKDVGEKINTQLSKLDEQIKATAKDAITYGRAYGKAETSSLKL